MEAGAAPAYDGWLGLQAASIVSEAGYVASYVIFHKRLMKRLHTCDEADLHGQVEAESAAQALLASGIRCSTLHPRVWTVPDLTTADVRTDVRDGIGAVIDEDGGCFEILEKNCLNC